jgi:hypothetical protein
VKLEVDAGDLEALANAGLYFDNSNPRAIADAIRAAIEDWKKNRYR